MSLQIGQQLGSFEITSLIGKGGMGEVYRAKDTKLKRDVAIKILPDEFSRDTDRVSRFQREAEALAALNHQNIAAIYDLQQSDATRFLILEFVEGDTLADILKKRGALPVDEALQIAKQICEALEAAHEKGIIHRDLKPANVKITPDGKVKVLDFGLAKAFENEPANAALSNSPTLSMAATNPGVILGTAAYMSPEQARGKPVNKATDIWAFGCVLYELLSGRQVFEGEDVTDVLAAVVKTEPDWNGLPEATPPAIRVLLRRCLRKDRRQRLQDATGVRIEIEDVLSEPAGLTAAVTPSRTRRQWVRWIGAMVVIAAASIYATTYFRPAPAEAPESRLDVTAPEASSRDPRMPTISPDGRLLVFVASPEGKYQLWIRPLDSAVARPLAGTDSGTYPFWSPDSRSLGFFADGKLKRIDVTGGPAQILASAAEFGGTWNADGTIVFAGVPGGPNILYRISAAGGEPAAVTPLETGQSFHGFPQFLPDGHHFLFFVNSTTGPDAESTYLGSLDGGAPKRLLSSRSRFAPPGFLLFPRGDTLMAQRFNTEKLELAGDPFPLADRVVWGSSQVGGPEFSAGDGGRVVYRTGANPTGSIPGRFVWFDRSGKEIGGIALPEWDMKTGDPELSPDSRRVAVRRNVDRNNDVWLIETDRGVATRLTRDAAADTDPLWSPNGDRIVFSSTRKGAWDLYETPSSGGGTEELLLRNTMEKRPTSWSSDGRFILYTQSDPKAGHDLWALPLFGDRKQFPIAYQGFEEQDGQFSPNMRWIAYETNESGRFEIFVQPFPSATAKWQVSIGGGTQPRWRGDGKELFYIAPDGTLMVVSISVTSNGEKLEAGKPVRLFRTLIQSSGSYNEKPQYAMMPDGQQFLMIVPVQDATSHITVLLNWKPSAK